MPIINNTGITNGGTIQAEHITRAIDVLSGVSVDTIIATGSFSGSVTGNIIGTASFATQALSSSFSISGSRAVSASFASTASFVNTLSQTVRITGSILTSGSITTLGLNTLGLSVVDSTTLDGSLDGVIAGTKDLQMDLSNLGDNNSSGYFAVPIQSGSTPTNALPIGSMYFNNLVDPPQLEIWGGSSWRIILIDL